MKHSVILSLLLVVTIPVYAQSASNPIIKAVRQIEVQQAQNLTAVAEKMPANMYMYRPTSREIPFARIVMHVADSNNVLCAHIAGKEPVQRKITENDPKSTLVEALESSFGYCEQVLATIDDSRLRENVALMGSQKLPTEAAFIELVRGWASHYEAAVSYLRLSGALPAEAARK